MRRVARAGVSNHPSPLDESTAPGAGAGRRTVVQDPSEDAPSDEELRRLFDAIGEGLVLLRGGHVVWANAALARMTGAGAAKDLVGLALGDLLADAGEGVPGAGSDGPVRCRLLRAGLEARAVVVEPVSRAGAGTEARTGTGPGLGTGTGTGTGTEARAGTAAAAAAAAGSGMPGDLALRVRDLTDLHTLESEVLRTGRALHEANRALAALRERTRGESAEREELLTVVSHELRTPCTVIQGYNRLLLSGRFGELSDKQRYFLEESQKSCQRLNTFIGNLLETARRGLAVGPLEVAEAPLAPIVESVARQLGPLLEERRLRIDLALAPETPRARFDPPRIEQVLTNLIGNALKFAPADSAVEVTLGAVERGGRRFAEIAVLDAGPGVDARDGERIFEPYVQAGDTRRAGGLGLGLAICRRIVEAHGGQIGVKPRTGGGSRFAFTLPTVGSSAVESGTADPGTADPGTADPGTADPGTVAPNAAGSNEARPGSGAGAVA